MLPVSWKQQILHQFIHFLDEQRSTHRAQAAQMRSEVWETRIFQDLNLPLSPSGNNTPPTAYGHKQGTKWDVLMKCTPVLFSSSSDHWHRGHPRK